MKYRKYYNQIKIGALFILALGFSACATTNNSQDQNTYREPSSVNTEKERDIDRPHRYDGREPSSMKGDFTWLNEVESDFDRIAAETSKRAIANQNKQEVLLKQKDWTFSYLPRTNHFYVVLQGTQYQMAQTKINDGERFAFAAEGQAENPLTFSVARSGGRSVASGISCDAEISYWSKSAKSYVTERKSLGGKPCERMMGLLKEYVP
jgi:hypothetical protein